MKTAAKPVRKQKREEEGRRLEAAFQRLMAQDPAENRLESDELREMLEEPPHRIPITQDNVAKEAGLSRKLLTGNDCPFPDLAARIRAVKSSNVSPSTTAELDRLTKENVALRHTVKVIRSKMAEAILRAERAVLDLQREKAQVDRLRRQLMAGGGRRIDETGTARPPEAHRRTGPSAKTPGHRRGA